MDLDLDLDADLDMDLDMKASGQQARTIEREEHSSHPGGAQAPDLLVDTMGAAFCLTTLRAFYRNASNVSEPWPPTSFAPPTVDPLTWFRCAAGVRASAT
jgi:hypothetical protein